MSEKLIELLVEYKGEGKAAVHLDKADSDDPWFYFAWDAALGQQKEKEGK